MKPLGHVIYLDGIKATYCGLTAQGLVKVLTAGRVKGVRPDRVRWGRTRSDVGGKHRRAA